MDKDIKTILEQLFGKHGRLVTESYRDTLWFPEFDIECFRKDYEEWKQANEINKHAPARPEKPVMTQRMSTDRINMTPVEKADAELKRRGIENPENVVLKKKYEPSYTNYEWNAEQYSVICWLRKQLKNLLLTPDHSYVVYLIVNRRAKKNGWFLERLTEINKYKRLLDPECSWISEDMIERKLYDILHDEEFNKELDDLVEMCGLTNIQRKYFIDNIRKIYNDLFKAIPMLDKMRKQARIDYEKECAEYNNYLDSKHSSYDRQKEYDELRKSLIKKYRDEDVPEYGTEDNEEKYRDDMEKYHQDMIEYKNKMRYFGK